MDLSVVIPVYNEESNLRQLCEELLSALNSLEISFEIIFIDDNSTDSSVSLIEEMVASHPNLLKAVLLRKNSGQSAAFDAGFRESSGNIVVTLDADLQNDPKDIPSLIEKLKSENLDLVTGWRRGRQDSLLSRKIPSKAANWFIRKITGIKIHDLGCSLKVYKRDIVDSLRLHGEMHRFLVVLAHDLGAKIGEIPVNHRPRTGGVSKYGITRTFKVLLDLLTVWFTQHFKTKPMYVFGGVGLLTAIVSVLLFTWVGLDMFFMGVKVHRNPLFIIAITLMANAAQFFGLGLIAEILIRIYYEPTKPKSYQVERRIGFPT